MTTLLWLRDDLRTLDHEALTAAVDDAHAAEEGDVVALWIREEGATDDDDGRLGPRPLGAAARWWNHRSLEVLAGRLEALGIPLVHARGDARTLVPRIAESLDAGTVRWSRRYAPRSRALDAQLKARLTADGRAAHSHPGALLTEPWQVTTGAGGDFRVFTPFHRAAAQVPLGPPLPVPAPLPGPGEGTRAALETLRTEGTLLCLDALDLLDTDPTWWEDTVQRHWTPGEEAALAQLDGLDAALDGYGVTRDLPAAEEGTSRLSPRLRSGELSPRLLWHTAQAARQDGVAGEDVQAWVRQLYWREFCWSLTYHHPDLDWRPLRPQFAAFPYASDEDRSRAWKHGRTGIALVDAGMRQLWESGWLHNRVRMAVASLFCKNLLQPWPEGEAWFWDTLVDADEANNPVSWQWVAGSGADASPYFRIFNPDTQATKFDPEGRYTTRWVPELRELGGADIAPIVDLKESRREALDAYAAMKEATGQGG